MLLTCLNWLGTASLYLVTDCQSIKCRHTIVYTVALSVENVHASDLVGERE